MVGSCGFHCQASDQAAPGAPRHATRAWRSSPRPVLDVEFRSRRFIEQFVVVSGTHGSCGLSPPIPRPPQGPHNDPSWLCVEFHLLGQLRRIQQGLGYSNALGITDAHDSRLGGHSDYSVITCPDSRKEGRSARVSLPGRLALGSCKSLVDHRVQPVNPCKQVVLLSSDPFVDGAVAVEVVREDVLSQYSERLPSCRLTAMAPTMVFSRGALRGGQNQSHQTTAAPILLVDPRRRRRHRRFDNVIVFRAAAQQHAEDHEKENGHNLAHASLFTMNGYGHPEAAGDLRSSGAGYLRYDLRILATTVKCGSTMLAMSYSRACPMSSEEPRSSKP